MTIIATVFRSGGDFEISHVRQLHSQFNRFPSVCFSDKMIPGVATIPFRYNWPGWFAKMELFDPRQSSEDLLYFDLDTLITGNLTPYMHGQAFCNLSDFFSRKNLPVA